MTQSGNILPHNSLTAAGVLDELKKLKGDKPWIYFEPELLTAQYPDNTIFKAALKQYTTKTAAATTQPRTNRKAAKQTEVK